MTSPSPPGRQLQSIVFPLILIFLMKSSVPHRRHKKGLQQLPPSGRASVVLPLLSNAGIFQKRDDNIGYGALQEDRALHGSDGGSVVTRSSPELPSSPLHRSAGHARSSEDLYSWMAKQDVVEPFSGCMESKIDMLPGNNTYMIHC